MKKKGFTLIELLAVIVILAVIALIATPLIMNVIEESRKSSFRVSVENMIRAMETDQATQGFVPLSYNFPLAADTTLKLDGKVDDWQGKSSIDQDGKTEASIYNGTYCAYKKKNDTSVSIEKVNSKEECLELNGSNLPVMMEGELASLDIDTIIGADDSKFLNGPISRGEIESIRFSDSKEVPGTVLGSFDVSENQDESVIAYYSDNDGNRLYEIVIGGEGGVAASASARGLFAALYQITIIDSNNFDTSQVTDMNLMFTACQNLTELDVSNFDTSQVTDMSWMFYYCASLTELDVSSFDTSQVTDMNHMFYYCTSLAELDVSNFDTSNVTNMASMFEVCLVLTKLDVSNFNTAKVTDMNRMFIDCRMLTELDVSKFNTSNVTNMMGMFANCPNLKSLNVSYFVTSNVTNMMGMFQQCQSLTELDLSNFDTSQVTDMNAMFLRCQNLTELDVSNMTFDQVTDYNSMFSLVKDGIAITAKDSNAKAFIEARLSDARRTGTVTIAS